MTKITEVSDQLVPLDQGKSGGEMVLLTPSQPPLLSAPELGAVLGGGGHAGADGASLSVPGLFLYQLYHSGAYFLLETAVLCLAPWSSLVFHSLSFWDNSFLVFTYLMGVISVPKPFIPGCPTRLCLALVSHS